MPNLPDPVLIVAVLGSIALAPFLALLITSYTKIVIVLGLLRMALGTQQVPPNMVMNGIAIILSVFVMAPVAMDAFERLQATPMAATGPKGAARFEDFTRVASASAAPIRSFLDRHTDERERRFFLRAASQLWPPERAAQLTRDDLLVLIPSFTLTEVTEAFQIGFLLYLAFVVVDLLVGNLLLALGMSMVSPTVVSVPFKLLLFIALDGWSNLVQGLLLSYK